MGTPTHECGRAGTRRPCETAEPLVAARDTGRRARSPLNHPLFETLDQTMKDHLPVVAVVGLGYVGLPLAVEFGKTRPTIGLDLSAQKVAAYRRFEDPTGEVSSEQ